MDGCWFFKLLLGHSQSLSKREWVDTVIIKQHQFVENGIESPGSENCDRIIVMRKL